MENIFDTSMYYVELTDKDIKEYREMRAEETKFLTKCIDLGFPIQAGACKRDDGSEEGSYKVIGNPHTFIVGIRDFQSFPRGDLIQLGGAITTYRQILDKRKQEQGKAQTIGNRSAVKPYAINGKGEKCSWQDLGKDGVYFNQIRYRWKKAYNGARITIDQARDYLEYKIKEADEKKKKAKEKYQYERVEKYENEKAEYNRQLIELGAFYNIDLPISVRKFSGYQFRVKCYSPSLEKPLDLSVHAIMFVPITDDFQMVQSRIMGNRKKTNVKIVGNLEIEIHGDPDEVIQQIGDIGDSGEVEMEPIL